MRLVEAIQINHEKNRIVFTLDTNRNIKRVVVSSEKTFSKNIEVKYAQNQILSELMTFGESPNVTGEQRLTFEGNTPAAASHIIVIGTGFNIGDLDVSIYEEEEINDECYPDCIDKELSENYYIDTVSVSLKSEAVCKFSLYTSMDGRDFDFAGTKEPLEAVKDKTFLLNGKEARIIRVYVEYVAVGSDFEITDIAFCGTKSNTEYQELPPVNVLSFDESEYNINVTENDTYDEIYGIIERKLGEKYKNWFEMRLSEGGKYDYFELSDLDGKILIEGNTGVSLAVGLNHYLKYFCKVNISQAGKQTKMPSNILPIGEKIRKETKAKIRYAYNYCTHSYTMAFWGETEWRDELDLLALNGVNLVLDLTAQEEVWRRFLGRIGYDHKEIKDYLAGPCYYAWAYMANLFGVGGPLHDSWFEDRTELARKNHLAMRRLGMMPILQGYSGMVPVDICDYDKDAEVIEQGMWCVTTRPFMLRTTSESYKKYARLFYECQREVYGNYSTYYATDPFHEGGRTADMLPSEISRIVLSEMLEVDRNATWVIQSWQGNPSSELLRGIEKAEDGKKHALILDLYAEKKPNYGEGGTNNPNHGYDKEFNYTPWIFCMLNNFGGRLGLHGHLDNLVKNVPLALNESKVNYGIGIAPEASENNPVLYDFLFECIWQDDARMPIKEVNIDEWLATYSERRYGKTTKNVNLAWQILKNTVYKSELNMIGQGAPECVLNARPAFEISSASAWGNSQISYDAKELKEALKLLSSDYDELCLSEGYMYDLTSLTLQVLSNSANEEHKKLKVAYKAGDITGFKDTAEKLLDYADMMDYVASANKYYLLGRWTSMAERLAEKTDDFTRHLYKFDSKALVTTWGAFNQSEIGCLHDYSNRPWSGLIKDVYKVRWDRWLSEIIKELRGKESRRDINWFELEWLWAGNDKSYPEKESQIDILSVIRKVL